MVVITGTSQGIGKAVALKFLNEGFCVAGLDIQAATIVHQNYKHYVCDISDKNSLPDLQDVEILINNAGIQTQSERDIKVNLYGTMYVTQKYAFQKKIKSVVFNASASANSGNEFPEYAASKAGVVGYMKHCAIKLANEYMATCNALCFGGISTELNSNVMNDSVLWKRIMDVTPLKRWATAEEAADWFFFLAVVNKFCTGQSIEVSGGERNCADIFVWPDE